MKITTVSAVRRLTVLGALLLTAGAVQAHVIWINPNGGLYSDPANWEGGVAPPSAPEKSVFIGKPEGPYTVTLDIDTTIESLLVATYGDQQKFDVNGRSLTINKSTTGEMPGEVLVGGVLILSNNGILRGNEDFTVNGALDWTSGKISGPNILISTSGQLDISGPGVKTLNHSILNAGTATMIGTGIMYGPATGSAPFRNPGIFNTGAFTTIKRNVVFRNSGTVNPGGPTGRGVLSISQQTNTTPLGTFSQSPTGNLNIQIAGRTPGTQYDQLRVTGAVSLNGNLNIILEDEFVPVLGDRFRVVSYTSRVGASRFANITGLNFAPGLAFRPDYTPTGLVLTVVSASGSIETA